MNELLFFSHTLVTIVFILMGLKLGRSCLITAFSLQIGVANLLVFKQMSFFGLTITCTEMLSIGSILTLNLIQEYFGKESAKKAIWISFFILLFYVVTTQFHLLYIPSPFDTSHGAYVKVLSCGPRVIFASLIVSFIVQQLDMHLYGFIQRKMAKRYIVLRGLTSLVISQLVDTVLFSYLGLYGLVHNIFHVICASYAIKMVVILTMSPFTALTKTIIAPRSHEQLR